MILHGFKNMKCGGFKLNSTINYYKKAELFIDNIVNINMSSLYEIFEEFLEPECRIMDFRMRKWKG